MEIGLSLGANLGDRLQNLKAAKKLIIAAGKISIVVQSPVYETEPVDVPAADKSRLFLNAVLILKTARKAPELLNIFRRIELEMGRDPGAARNAGRPIDIDVIYAGNKRIAADGITIPHPRWFKRRFVLQPLCDVRPDLVIPGQAVTVREILERLPDKHQVKFSGPASAW